MKKISTFTIILALFADILAFCMCKDIGGDSSDSRDPGQDGVVHVIDNPGVYVGTWKFDIDLLNQTAGITDITSAARKITVSSVDGHTVGVLSGPEKCKWDDESDTLKCDVVIYNYDTDESMWNVRTKIYNCTEPEVKVKKADYLWEGDTLSIPNFDSDKPITSQDEWYVKNYGNITMPIENSGYCITENGKNGHPFEGCDIFYSTKTSLPYQYIHPRCGKRKITYEFEHPSDRKLSLYKTKENGAYSFFTDIYADFYPEIPRDGNTLLDPRWNGPLAGFTIDGIQDHLTFIINLNDLEDEAPKNKGWIIGSSRYQAGNGLMYGKSNTIDDPILENGRYFAVEVLYEYPDRMETYEAIGDLNGPQKYEYFDNYSMAIYWDDAVIRKVDSIKKLTPGGTTIGNGVFFRCNSWEVGKYKFNNCGNGWMGHQPFSNSGMATSSIYSDYISTSYIVNDFSSNIAGYYYFPDPSMTTYYYNYVIVSADAPNWRGQLGIAHFDLATGALVQDGADPEPDWSVGIVYFWVNGDEGNGTEIALTQNSFTIPTSKWTNGDISGGSMYRSHYHYYSCGDSGFMPVSDDNQADCHTAGQYEITIVDGGDVKSNPLLPGGYAIVYHHPDALGGYQVKNAHVCVQ